jgi:hypothetical protein
MLCHVALVRTDVSEEPSASFIRVTRIGELGTTQAAKKYLLSCCGDMFIYICPNLPVSLGIFLSVCQSIKLISNTINLIITLDDQFYAIYLLLASQ